MEVKKIKSINELNNYLQFVKSERVNEEKNIIKQHESEEIWYLDGFCELCGKNTKFLVQNKEINCQTGRFRRSLKCKICNLINRKRFVLSYLQNFIENSKTKCSVYMYEQITDVYKFAQKEFYDIILVGSEFLGYDKKPGEIVHTIRNESALDLSFKDESFDIIISQDVYEHVPDIKTALKEAFRILKQNARILVTIPFKWDKEKTVRRAELIDGNERHHLPPEYHGNPVSKKGSLVFYDFGWDFVSMLREAGFRDAYMLVYYSLELGYIGNGFQFIFVAEK